MTRDEAIKIFGTMLFSAETQQRCPLGTHEEVADAIKMAIEALKKESVLDKIRAEIVETQKEYKGYGWAYDDALKIIDKYIEADKEAAAEDAQDTIPVQSGAEHDM